MWVSDGVRNVNQGWSQWSVQPASWCKRGVITQLVLKKRCINVLFQVYTSKRNENS